LLDGHYKLAWCQFCRSYFQINVLSDECLPNFYETVVASSLDDKTQRRTTESVKRDEYFASIAAKIFPGGQVLDFGAGWGHFLDVAKDWGMNTIAVEFNETQQKHLRRHHRVVALTDLQDQAIDFIRADQVFEHVSHPLELLKDLVRKLSPSGVIAISVPPDFNPLLLSSSHQRIKREDWNAEKGTRWSMNDVAPLEHVQCFSDMGLQKLGAVSGLRPWNPSFSSALRARSIRLPVQHILRQIGLHTGTIFFRR
jgi:ubiquinone/menaquinone biosynthesis C-methylase UbiE